MSLITYIRCKRKKLCIVYYLLLGVTVLIGLYFILQARTTTAKQARTIANIFALKIDSNIVLDENAIDKKAIYSEKLTKTTYMPKEYVMVELYQMGLKYIRTSNNQENIVNEIETYFSITNNDCIQLIKQELLNTVQKKEGKVIPKSTKIKKLYSIASIQTIMYYVGITLAYVDVLILIGFIVYSIVDNKELKKLDHKSTN